MQNKSFINECRIKAPHTREVAGLDLAAQLKSELRDFTNPTRQRESSDKPRLNAFCRVAPSVRFSDLAILPAVVFLRAPDFKSRMSAAVQARLLDLFTINTPVVEGGTYKSKHLRKKAHRRRWAATPLPRRFGFGRSSVNVSETVTDRRSLRAEVMTD
jgi:hypothetical protein